MLAPIAPLFFPTILGNFLFDLFERVRSFLVDVDSNSVFIQYCFFTGFIFGLSLGPLC